MILTGKASNDIFFNEHQRHSQNSELCLLGLLFHWALTTTRPIRCVVARAESLQAVGLFGARSLASLDMLMDWVIDTELQGKSWAGHGPGRPQRSSATAHDG